MILDLGDVIKEIRSDKNLVIVTDLYRPRQIIESLVSQPMSPCDHPSIIDDVTAALEADNSNPVVYDHQQLDNAGMVLEWYQNDIDRRIMQCVRSKIETISYEVTKWLNKTTALISINPKPPETDRR